MILVYSELDLDSFHCTIVFNKRVQWVSKWVSDCCLTPNEVYHGDPFTPCVHAIHCTTNAGIYHNIGQGGKYWLTTATVLSLCYWIDKSISVMLTTIFVNK
jgi:hypothetical protein